ncbi:hypothetical protein Nizo1840_1781 [Lactiplantibacillus plantarum]|nr:hypothetical protein SF2A35B_1876 [Lactiplantibacillus plantarum]KZT81497.1 hypothetical protein Nizo1839_1295 [Lactiplantibacillus plantarum]KZT82894.1 hypothetical protein Nizo1840_1781 [Lactiplantibacillus plantarum]KZU14696.1 hypothetical protein Nizo2264_0892 [Lactiplantibacillus plantarum]
MSLLIHSLSFLYYQQFKVDAPSQTAQLTKLKLIGPTCD